MQKEHLFVIITGILSGFLVFGGQVFFNLGLSLFQFSLIIQLLVVIMLLPFILFNKNLRPKRWLSWLMVLYGFGTAITVFAQYGAIILGVPVAIVVLLLYTQPLWTTIIGELFLKEKLTKIRILACILVLIGVVILVNPFNAGQIKSWVGIIIALVGGIGLSSWVVLGSVISKRKSPPIITKFLNATLTGIFFLLFYPILLIFTKSPSIVNFSFNLPLSIWIYLILFSLFLEVISHILYYKGTKKIPTVDAGIIMLLEPVVGSLLATIFLSQALTINIIIGGILILIANYLVIKTTAPNLND